MGRPPILALTLAVFSLACNLGTSLQPETPTPLPPTAPPTDTDLLTPAATSTPAATEIPIGPPDMWSAFHSPTEVGWMLDPSGAYQRNLPFRVGQYYDYSIPLDTVLYATEFADHGAGPGNLAVSDLFTVQVESGVTTPIITDENVVEALWMPNGMDIVYALATDTTHELRLRTSGGDDLLLAQDIAPVFGPSPTGNYVAFTRETGYDVPGAPGVYVVDLASNTEVMVSDVDRGGSGSIDDQPAWSWDETYLLMVHFSGPGVGPNLAKRDGSGNDNLTFADDLTSEDWYDPIFTAPHWAPDNRHVLALSNAAPPGGGMGGPSYLIWIEIDPESFMVVDGQSVGEALGIYGWQVPGESFWAISPETGEPVLMEIP